jgi:hypothetical protein
MFRPWMKWDCLDFMSPYGPDFGHLRALRIMSSASSMPLPCTRMADPLVIARLADLGLQFPPRDEQTPAALGALQKAEIEKWWPIIKAANIKSE